MQNSIKVKREWNSSQDLVYFIFYVWVKKWMRMFYPCSILMHKPTLVGYWKILPSLDRLGKVFSVARGLTRCNIWTITRRMSTLGLSSHWLFWYIFYSEVPHENFDNQGTHSSGSHKPKGFRLLWPPLFSLSTSEIHYEITVLSNVRGSVSDPTFDVTSPDGLIIWSIYLSKEQGCAAFDILFLLELVSLSTQQFNRSQVHKPPSLPDTQEALQLYGVSDNLENQTAVVQPPPLLKARLHL